MNHCSCIFTNIFKPPQEFAAMLYFITSNRHKYEEVAQLTDLPIEQKRIDYPEVQADTLEEVAAFGITFCYAQVKTCCFIEDSGLFIDALSGFPGVYSQYVYRTLGCNGILRLLDTNRKAHFTSVIAYHTTEETLLFRGDVEGEIAEAEGGEKGFGFDPIFIPEGESQTFAQMSTEQKNLYSHRGKAFKMFLKHIEQVR
jgi:XTP/dITP diphosphohydrolase